MALRDQLAKAGPRTAAEKRALGRTLDNLHGVQEWLAEAVEAVEDLDVVEALAKASPWAEATGKALGDAAGFLHLQHQVHLRLLPNLKGILSHGTTRERFAPFRDLLTLDTLEARAQDALLEHADYQRWLFEEKKVLGVEPFTLRQVYTETDCGVLRWGEVDRSRRKGGAGQEEATDRIHPFLEEHGGRQPMVETVLNLLADPIFKDAIVLQGVAGSGKSSMTLRLAWELVRQGLRPIRIELKHLGTRISANAEEALPKAVHLTDRQRSPQASTLVFQEDLFLSRSIFRESVQFRGTEICP